MRHGLTARAGRALLLSLLLTVARSVAAQTGGARPHLDWYTLETPHFVVHYPREAAEWTQHVVARLEAVHESVRRAVGSAPAERVTIVVEDPQAVSNGFAYSILAQPTIVFWTVPPDPRNEIGTSRGWGEILSVHEFTHIAHLTRPSRRPRSWLARLLSPTPVGPVALGTPRWVREGYATVVEGRLTGSGRPHGVWRAAILREWALEGKLPTYAQLDGTAGFEGGAMAYLAGSAYLEWLDARAGDSSLVHLWRRLSARQPRSFGEAFSGVFKGLPDDLYGRFTAELTGKALEAERRLRLPADSTRGGRVELVQRLLWQTGDPALSPDATRLAITLRSRDLPSEVVLWKTADDPESEATRRGRARAQQLDPEDVPAVPYLPAAKRPLARLRPIDARGFSAPRFLADGKSLLVVHLDRTSEGAFRPDVWQWTPQPFRLRRVTRGAGIRAADPLPDGRAAIGVRCEGGVCDVVRIDLASGAVASVLRGSPTRAFDRPRVSPDGRRVALAVQEGGRWRVALVDLGDRSLRYADPDDGASRYDPSWLGDGRLVAVSERSGVPNLELLDGAAGSSLPLTQVVSAVAAPDVRGDSAIYFLQLHGKGWDLARLASGVRPLPNVVPLTDSALAPVAQIVATAPADTFAVAALPAPRPYGAGPRRYRWLPAAYGRPGQGSVGVAVVSSDPIGRLTWAAHGLITSDFGWSGATLEGVWRGFRPALRLGAFGGREELDAPSRELAGRRTTYAGAIAGVEKSFLALTLSHRLDAGASLGSVHLTQPAARATPGVAVDDEGGRALGYVRYRVGGNDRVGPLSTTTVADAGFTTGKTGGASWSRLRTALSIEARLPSLVALGDATYSSVSSGAPTFERLTLGGIRPPLPGDVLLAQQIEMPALPLGTVVDRRMAAYRLALGGGGIEPYFWAGSAAGDITHFVRWHRVWGAELARDTGPAGIQPFSGARGRLGVGYSVDEPYRRKWSLYGSVTLRP